MITYINLSYTCLMVSPTTYTNMNHFAHVSIGRERVWGIVPHTHYPILFWFYIHANIKNVDKEFFFRQNTTGKVPNHSTFYINPVKGTSSI